MIHTCRACERGGLCTTCHRLHAKTNTLHWFPCRPPGRWVLRLARLEDYRELAEQREDRERIAARLAVSVRTVERYAASEREAGAA